MYCSCSLCLWLPEKKRGSYERIPLGTRCGGKYAGRDYQVYRRRRYRIFYGLVFWNSQPELEEQIREMMDFYEGKMESYQGNASSHEKSEYGSTVYSELKAHYTVITDKDNYEIAFQYRMIDAEDPDQEGLVSFEIATEEAYQQDDFKWMCEDNPGVYVQR